MPSRSRLTNTEAISGRSAARPVSFSTIEARISAEYGSLSGESPARACPCRVEALPHQPVGADEEREIRRARRRKNTCPGKTTLRDSALGTPTSAQAPPSGSPSTVFTIAGFARERCRELGERAAFDDRQRRLRDIALRQLGEKPRQRDARGDLVIPRLDRSVDSPDRASATSGSSDRRTPARTSSCATDLRRHAGLHFEDERRRRQRQRPREPPSERNRRRAHRR